MEILHVILLIFYNILFVYIISYVAKKAKNVATKEDIKNISYEQQKGLNLATKEDIKDITKEIESIKVNFSNLINEFQIKYSFLHKKRALFFEILYKKLINSKNDIDYCCDLMQCADRKEKSDNYHKAFKILEEIKTLYEENSIYSTDNIDELFNNFLEKHKSAIKKINVGSHYKLYESNEFLQNPSIIEKAYKEIEEGSKILINDIPLILKEIKKEFKNNLQSSLV